MTLRLVFNPADTPVPIDTEGRVLGGGEWGTVESTDRAAGQALHADALLGVTPPEGVSDTELDPRFVAARNAHDELVARADKARRLDKGKLAELVPESEATRKTELVNEVAASDVKIPRSGGSRTSKES